MEKLPPLETACHNIAFLLQMLEQRGSATYTKAVRAGWRRANSETAFPNPCFRYMPSFGQAGVAELVDALVLGTSDESRGGSSPSARTNPAHLCNKLTEPDGPGP